MTQAGEEALRFSARAGLRVDNVLVTGRKRVTRLAVERALQVRRGMPMAAFDPHTAKDRLEKLAWIRSATVERQLPDTILIRINERRPLALWQLNGRMALIDVDGKVITRWKLSRYWRSPLVVGAGAAKHAAAIIRTLHGHPRLNARVRALVRVSKRRWDIKFKNGVIARLPEKNAARALATLDRLVQREHLLDRDVVAIDLRFKDRLVVRTTARPDAVGKKPEDQRRKRPTGTSKDT
jgi:cell division protein FtsQ